jgi:hypothetical protein
MRDSKMIEAIKDDSTDAGECFVFITSVMKENEKFLLENAGETYDEVISLIIDAINCVGLAVEGEKRKENYIKSSMVFFMYHILVPSSYAIQMNLLTGNLPMCFMELRLMLETLVKCCLADLKYPDQSFFQKKLELLGEETKKKTDKNKNVPKREYDFMKELDSELGLNEKSIKLWSKLSQDWVHTKGVINRIVTETIEKSDAPSWTVIIPIKYAKNDLDTIGELHKRISQFRSILKDAMGKCQQEWNF